MNNFSIYLSLLVCIIGAVVYLAIVHSRISDLGRIAFGAGLLVTLMTFAGKVLHG